MESLLGPLVKIAIDEEVKVLMTSCVGPLTSIPWAAMWDKERGVWLGQEFLLTRFAMSGTGQLLAAGKPAWNVVAFGNDCNAEGVSDIPGAIDEVKAVQEVTGGQSWSGADGFTRERFFATMKGESLDVVHLASHFHLEPASDSESYVLCSGGKGKISVRDLRGGDLRGYASLGLLVLSACQSGAEHGEGTGIENLIGSATNPGPSAVIAALWKVDDVGTKKLMSEFYRLQASGKGLTKIQCLSQAMEELRSGRLGHPGDSAWRGAKDSAKPSTASWNGAGLHPFYWAPFVLSGNWR